MVAIRNPNLGPSQIRAKRRRLFYIRLSIIVFLILIVVIGSATLSGHERIKIKTITITGNAAVSTADILAIIDRDLAGRYWHLFARRNFLIFPRYNIEADLLQEITTIQAVNVSWSAWQEISLEVTERKPHSVWCGETKAEEETCFFVDKTGYIYDQAPSFSGSIFIKDYRSLATTTDPVGQYFLPTINYNQIFNLIQILAQNNLRVLSVSYNGADHIFTLESGTEIIFNDKRPLILSFENFFSAIETGNLDLLETPTTISYVDLRFDNKVVVGRKEL